MYVCIYYVVPIRQMYNVCVSSTKHSVAFLYLADIIKSKPQIITFQRRRHLVNIRIGCPSEFFALERV